MSGMFQFRKLESYSQPTIKFSLSPEDALDSEQCSRARELEGDLDGIFARMFEEDAISLEDFGSEDEAEVIIPILDDAMDDLEADEALVITGVYVVGNTFLIAAFVTGREDEDEEEDGEEEEWQ